MGKISVLRSVLGFLSRRQLNSDHQLGMLFKRVTMTIITLGDGGDDSDSDSDSDGNDTIAIATATMR